MELSTIIYIFPHIFSILVFLLIIAKLSSKPKNKLISDYIMIMIAMLAVSIFKLIELLVPTDSLTIIFGKIFTCALILIPSMTFIFILRYIEKDYFLNKKIIFLIYLIPLIGFVSILTNDYHNMYFSSLSISYVNSNISTMIKDFAQIGFVIIFYNYFMAAISCIILAALFLNKDYPYKKQIIVLFLGIIMPILSNAIFIFFPFLVNQFGSDITVISFCATSILFLWSISNYKLQNVFSFF